jgi:hypothetical protein
MLLSFGIVWIAAFMLHDGSFRPVSTSPKHASCQYIIGTLKEKLNGNIDLVSREESRKCRDTVDRDARNDTQGVQPFSFPPVLSYEDMIIRGTHIFIGSLQIFEKISFPTKFPMGSNWNLLYSETQRSSRVIIS